MDLQKKNTGNANVFKHATDLTIASQSLCHKIFRRAVGNYPISLNWSGIFVHLAMPAVCSDRQNI